MITECVDARDVRHALELAVRAPSLHNSQPWKWRYDDHVVELYANFKRWLPATDTATRDLVLSCGAALHHLRLALAAAGIAASVDRRTRPGALDHLATLRLQKGPAAQAVLRMAAMINRRRTDRRRYGDWPVPDVFLEELQTCAAREGAVLRVLDRAGDRAAVVEALRDAAREQEVVSNYMIETTLWSGRRAGYDGIPPANLLADAEGTGDGLARRFEPGSIDQEEVGPDCAVLLVLGTASDDPVSRLRAGEALSAVLLHAADVGLATCPLSQPLEVSSTYCVLRDEVLGGHLAPQVLIRVGWAPPAAPLPPTPRRPLDDVIEKIGY
jgi:nitroreductase